MIAARRTNNFAIPGIMRLLLRVYVTPSPRRRDADHMIRTGTGRTNSRGYLLVAPLVLLGSPIAALAQNDVGSAAWLGGCWVASAGDVRSEEVWMNFQATEVSTQRLRFENPQHDFLQAIEYERTSPDSVTAKVYGEIGSRDPAFVLRYARRAC